MSTEWECDVCGKVTTALGSNSCSPIDKDMCGDCYKTYVKGCWRVFNRMVENHTNTQKEHFSNVCRCGGESVKGTLTFEDPREEPTWLQHKVAEGINWLNKLMGDHNGNDKGKETSGKKDS